MYQISAKFNDSVQVNLKFLLGRTILVFLGSEKGSHFFIQTISQKIFLILSRYVIRKPEKLIWRAWKKIEIYPVTLQPTLTKRVENVGEIYSKGMIFTNLLLYGCDFKSQFWRATHTVESQTRASGYLRHVFLSYQKTVLWTHTPCLI